MAGDESVLPKSCQNCIHVKTCAAFRAFAGALEQLKVNYEFIDKAPYPADTLASVCTEYTPLSKLFAKSTETGV